MEFEFKEKKGEGCFATVWRAIENKLEREVAIKIFNPSAVFVSNEANLQSTVSNMLLSHARLLAKVDHPNVVKIHYVTQVKNPQNGNIDDCIVMEYLNGTTLRKRLEKALTLEESIFIGNSVIDGLEAIHKKDIVHNDLHSQNIMVSPDIVKIIDPNSEQDSFVLLSTLTKNQQFERDITFLKEILGAIISKTINLGLEVPYYFKDKLLNEFDIQKIKEHFNEVLVNKTASNSEIAVVNSSENSNNENDILEQVKEYISDERYKIKLDNLVTNELRIILPKLSKENFTLNEPRPNAEKILARLNDYNNLTTNLEKIVIFLSQWGNNNQLSLFNKIFERLSDSIDIMDGGIVYWLKLRWYPLMILTYCSGISAISAGNYQYLYSLFYCQTHENTDLYYEKKYLINLLAKNLTQLDRSEEIFKKLPGYERYHVPTSEYIVEVVKPILEEILFLGRGYENLFNRFEIFFSLVYADLNTNGGYGPTGRFIYKYKDRFEGIKENNLYNQIIEEAGQKKDNWAPLQAGFFRGSYQRFIEVAESFRKYMESIQWH